jgi:putative peptide maturation dehydrogenase
MGYRAAANASRHGMIREAAMRVRRCTHLLLEPRERVSFGLAAILRGKAEVDSEVAWVALAAHLDRAVAVDTAECALLGAFSAQRWQEPSEAQCASPAVLRLLELGLLLGDQPEHARHLARDQAMRDAHWWPLAAVAHRHSRWQGVDSVGDMHARGLVTANDLRRNFGMPPPAVQPHDGSYATLPRQADDAFDALLGRRATCRNFDRDRPLPLPLLARLLQRTVMAQATVEAAPDTVFLKKHVPSGGGLHPVETYLLVQSVEGLAPGLYHYHPIEHALLALPSPPASELARLACTMLSGQEWFADAPAMIVLAPRFERCFWKYRNHAKAYRAVLLDVGHLSQALYLCATEAGLGAFVTAAINEADTDQALGLDGIRQGAVAIFGVGWRAERQQTTEFDPAHRVWA